MIFLGSVKRNRHPGLEPPSWANEAHSNYTNESPWPAPKALQQSDQSWPANSSSWLTPLIYLSIVGEVFDGSSLMPRKDLPLIRYEHQMSFLVKMFEIYPSQKFYNTGPWCAWIPSISKMMPENGKASKYLIITETREWERDRKKLLSPALAFIPATSCQMALMFFSKDF